MILGMVGGQLGAALWLTIPSGCPGHEWRPRLTIFRRTNQLGLGVPGTPIHPYQPFPPWVLNGVHHRLPCPACTRAYRGRG